MNFLYTIIGFVVGVGLVLFFSRSLRLLLRQARQKMVGICSAALGQSAKKRENKEKVLELLQKRGEISNSDIREALGVSPKTSVNYLDELEREGKVEQVGGVGQGVHYRLKK